MHGPPPLHLVPGEAVRERRPRRPRARPSPGFEGFPYLVTRVVPALHHVLVLPRAARSTLEKVAATQVKANRLDTCLVLGPEEAVYYPGAGGAPVPSTRLPAHRCAGADPVRDAGDRRGLVSVAPDGGPDHA